jgi:hypothetical protein
MNDVNNYIRNFKSNSGFNKEDITEDKNDNNTNIKEA